MSSRVINKLLDSSPSLLNLIFVGIMIGGSILILGSLYLIYDVQIFGERINTKTDLMMISITFTIIHIILTNALLIAFKKFRYAKTIIQNEKEELGNLFRKFYQINTSKNRERNSSGLGLSICSSIIELHHGKMWAESDTGCGTTIKFQLPLITNQQEVKNEILIEEPI